MYNFTYASVHRDTRTLKNKTITRKTRRGKRSLSIQKIIADFSFLNKYFCSWSFWRNWIFKTVSNLKFGNKGNLSILESPGVPSYLIFVTGITGGACGEFFCHVEKFLHMTDCHVEKCSTWQIVMWKKLSTWEMWRKYIMWRKYVCNLWFFCRIKLL